MPDNCSTLEEYAKDKRIACRYGTKCYQKNPSHHEKYKHPPKKANNNGRHTQAAKRIKIENEDKTVKEVKINNDVSESDSDESISLEKEESTKKESDSDESVSSEKERITKKECISETDNSDDERPEEDSNTETNKANQDNSKDTSTLNKTITNIDVKQFIKEKFLVDMPEDFYSFWDLCKQLKSTNPCDAFKDVGLILVGPYDVLAGKFENTQEKPESEYLIHWRYFYDTPEFQTVLKGDNKTGYHIGYWRDEPNKPPVFMAYNKARVDGVIQNIGENIFAAVHIHLEKLKKTGDPFQKMQIGKFQKAVQAKAKELDLDMSTKTNKMIDRERKIVTRTFNKIGLVVPYNRKSQLGYRELALNNKDLTQILNKLAKAEKEQQSKFLSELQPCLTYASIALDECDFGTGVELGWNIMAHGIKTLNSTAMRFLKSSYQLLDRNVFAKIAEAHLSNRREGTNLSIL